MKLQFYLADTHLVTILGMATILLIYYKYNFGVRLCPPNGNSNLLCSTNGLHNQVTWLHCGRAPTSPFITRWAYSTLVHVYRQRPNNSGERSSFSHIASCYQR